MKKISKPQENQSSKVIFDENNYVFSILRFYKMSLWGTLVSLPCVLLLGPPKTAISLFELIVFLIFPVAALFHSYVTGKTFSSYGIINIVEDNVFFSASQIIFTAIVSGLIFIYFWGILL